MRRVRRDLQKLPSTSVNEKLNYLFDPNKTEYLMHGFFHSAHSHRRHYNMETTTAHVPRSIITEGDDIEDFVDDADGIMSGEVKRYEEAEISSRLRSKPAVATPAASSGSRLKAGALAAVDASAILPADMDRKRGKANMQEMKKKWTSIQKSALALNQSTKGAYGGTSRPSYDSLQKLLLEAYEARPMPSDMVLDEAVYKSLRENMLELIEVIYALYLL